MTDVRKLIETDGKKSNGAKNEGWEYYVKKGGAGMSRTIFVSMATARHTHAALCYANGGSESCIFGIPPDCDWFSKSGVRRGEGRS